MGPRGEPPPPGCRREAAAVHWGSPKVADSTAVDRPGTPPLEIRKHLGTMGMGGPEALQKMGTLSGGQKSRIAFAQIMWQKPHVLSH